ncbi:(2Fe-2S)-binding protein, partial [Klebsiella pneumoniae]|uniref:(2Fe-2S)-binding protein n=2 Tax=Pseudomonadota TaxID=1224 RepID=UPI003305BA20
MSTAGADYSATPKTKPVCGCTDHGHQAVRDAIFSQHLTHKDQVFKALGWRTPNGCSTCRP